MANFEVSQVAFEEHKENEDGICLSCGAWSSGGVENDAEEYECENCGEDAVCGAEQALLYDELTIEDDNGDEDNFDTDDGEF